MNTNTKRLYDQGVSIWLDNITRKMIDDGTLKKYIEGLTVTGLTSNPTIFEGAIAKTNYYDDAIAKINKSGLSDEELFFSLAIEDIQRAADAFFPVFKKTNGLDGFVSIEVSPLLAYDAKSTIKAAKKIYGLVKRPNVFIKIPGTPEGLPAIEESIAAGIPINITLLFSAEQYEAAAMAYLRGIETRIKNELNPDVRSVASVFVSRWDKSVADKVPENLKNKLGIAVMNKIYHIYQTFLSSNRVRRIINFGASPQRLLWASTGTKDPNASDILYVKSLIAPFTVNTIPEKTLLAYADHGELNEPMVDDTVEADKIIEQYGELSIDYFKLAEQLQKEGAESFNTSWDNLIKSIASKRKQIET